MKNKNIHNNEMAYFYDGWARLWLSQIWQYINYGVAYSTATATTYVGSSYTL